MKKSKSKKKIVIIILISLLVILIVGWGLFSVSMYEENFNVRLESYEPIMFHVEDFDGLQSTRYEFTSDKGQKLVGYMYSAGEEQRGIIVIAHGFGAGHNSYMDCADYFAKHGYYVFAYDATGNDESEGAGVGGVPQGVVDLEHAISFVEQSGNFPDLPIALFGHSWGGYSVSAVLTYHPEVKAVIECSGCNCSSDLFEAGGKDQAGEIIYTMMPFIKLHELIRYGGYASNTAMDGFAASGASVMVIHSADDSVVPIEYGYDIYYKKYKDDPRFTFVRYEDKGHNSIFNASPDVYKDEIDTELQNWADALDYDYKADENKDRFRKDKADYIHEHLDRKRWCDRLDKEMFDSFVKFYDEHIA